MQAPSIVGFAFFMSYNKFLWDLIVLIDSTDPAKNRETDLKSRAL